MSKPLSIPYGIGGPHGIVRRADLRKAGLGEKRIDRFVAGDQVIRLHRGVYAINSGPTTWMRRQLAACYATGGLASHRAALRLWDKGMDYGEDWPVEVTVGAQTFRQPKGVIVHRSRTVGPEDQSTRYGIPVTTPHRMLVDIGAVMDRDEVSEAAERCIVAGLLSIATLRHELDRPDRRRRNGAAVLRSVVDDWPLADNARVDSVLEVAFARLCQRSGLPLPVFQYELTLAGRRRRLDFAYPDQLIAIEVDGFACRTDRDVFQDERRRHTELEKAGWRVVRFTWEDVMHHPGWVVETICFYLGLDPTSPKRDSCL